MYQFSDQVHISVFLVPSMARLGDADPRWIVADRTDGANVNEWHWEQRDKTMHWKEHLAQQFKDRELCASDSYVVQAHELTAFNGEVTVASRKGKPICFFEMNFELSWSVKSKSDDNELLKGRFKIVDCDTQNFEEEHEIRVTKAESSGGDAEDDILSFVRKEAVPCLREMLKQIIRNDLMGVQNLLTRSSTNRATCEAAKSTTSEAKGGEPSKEEKLPNSTSLKMHLVWQCSPTEVYECLTEQRRVSAYTRAPCRIDPQPGGEVSLLDGAMTGKIIEATSPCNVKMQLRMKSWDPISPDSMVHIRLKEKEGEEGKTVMEFEHSEFPFMEKERVSQGWKNVFWEGMKKMFGYHYELS